MTAPRGARGAVKVRIGRLVFYEPVRSPVPAATIHRTRGENCQC